MLHRYQWALLPPPYITPTIPEPGPVDPPVTGDWQLTGDGTSADSHWLAAKLQPVIVHPRPDSECNSWERHRMAPEGIAWRIPVRVKGGARPFRYSVDSTSATKGISIGETYGSTDYGILSWASPTVGSHTIRVAVQTQEYGRNVSGFTEPVSGSNTGFVEFTLDVYDREDTARFLFLDSVAGNNANSGAYSSPKQTLAHIYASTSYSGRQLFLRGGTYTTDGTVAVPMDSSHPAVIVGYPGETATLSYTQKGVQVTADGGGVFGVALTDGGISAVVGNVWAMYSGSNDVRKTFFECNAHDWPSPGTVNSDNAGIFNLRTSASTHQYFVVSHCTFTGLTFSPGIWFGAQDFCIEDNVWTSSTVGGGNGGYGWRAKDSCYDGTIAFNESWDGITVTSNQSVISIASQVNSANVEVCYNRFADSTTAKRLIDQNALNVGGPFWFYRNSMKGRARFLDDPPTPTEFLSNAWEYSTSEALTGIAGIDYSLSNTECHATSGVFDASMNLTGGYTAYRGMRGAEIE